MSTEQKRKELEAANYIVTNINQVITPDGAEYFTTDDEPSAINKAYEHLQREQKLKALEVFVLKIDNRPILIDAKQIEEYYDDIQADAHMLIVKHNITADDESDNE